MSCQTIEQLVNMSKLFTIKRTDVPLTFTDKMVVEANPLRVYLAFGCDQTDNMLLDPVPLTTTRTQYPVGQSVELIEFWIERHKTLVTAEWHASFKSFFHSCNVTEVIFTG